MHELSLCGAIADIVSRRAEGREVEIVHVRIGQLRQVVPDTLTFCWSLVVADTSLQRARLDIERVGAQLRCRQCGCVFDLGDQLGFACAQCAGLDVEVVRGEEFDVTALELTPV